MSEGPSRDQQLQWQHTAKIAIPSSESEGRMAIRFSDWERITHRLCQTADPLPKLTIWYAILFGVAATSGLSIIPISMSSGLPPWVTPLYVCIFAFSLLCAIVFVMLDRRLSKGRTSAVEDILKDMQGISKVFEEHGKKQVRGGFRGPEVESGLPQVSKGTLYTAQLLHELSKKPPE